jgi:hypothetical protein
VTYELGFISQKTAFFIVTAVNTSNLTLFEPPLFPLDTATILALQFLLQCLQCGTYAAFSGDQMCPDGVTFP